MTGQTPVAEAHSEEARTCPGNDLLVAAVCRPRSEPTTARGDFALSFGTPFSPNVVSRPSSVFFDCSRHSAVSVTNSAYLCAHVCKIERGLVVCVPALCSSPRSDAGHFHHSGRHRQSDHLVLQLDGRRPLTRWRPRSPVRGAVRQRSPGHASGAMQIFAVADRTCSATGAGHGRPVGRGDVAPCRPARRIDSVESVVFTAGSFDLGRGGGRRRHRPPRPAERGHPQHPRGSGGGDLPLPPPPQADLRLGGWLSTLFSAPAGSAAKGRAMTLTVGVPTEVKNNEYRVALTPDGSAAPPARVDWCCRPAPDGRRPRRRRLLGGAAVAHANMSGSGRPHRG